MPATSTHRGGASAGGARRSSRRTSVRHMLTGPEAEVPCFEQTHAWGGDPAPGDEHGGSGGDPTRASEGEEDGDDDRETRGVRSAPRGPEGRADGRRPAGAPALHAAHARRGGA